MDPGNCDDIIFSATLRPHRSLGRRGFLALMAVIAGLWFVTGLYFVALGAWPVLGFVGLDLFAIWLAFHLNYRAARAYEDVEVSRTALLIRKVNPSGRAQEIRLNPQWARLEVQQIEDEGVTALPCACATRASLSAPSSTLMTAKVSRALSGRLSLRHGVSAW
jgi:uncharacterized membrane protein